MALLLGCIADDLTGATDLANTLARQGMRTVQMIGVPAAGEPLPAADAIVVALKSRTIPAAEAVAHVAARRCRWLQGGGRAAVSSSNTARPSIRPTRAISVRWPMRCSTSSATSFTIACPAFPENKRTIYLGHLFVGGELLSDSSMRNHPLTPMTDANLVRVLGRQTTAKVGLVPFASREAGTAGDRRGLRSGCARTAPRYAIVDAVEDRHLLRHRRGLRRAAR